ncbi:MAG: alkaline phosphatase family protein [Daejeonella sp.]
MMTTRKVWLLLFLFMFACTAKAQTKIENLIVITTDGLRWQEVFKGMDNVIANSKRFNQGARSYIYKKYGAANQDERRKKLMPFLWGTVAKHGQLYGNRLLGNKVNNANSHWFSYPGYSELFTGYADPEINSNNYPNNPNTSVLEFLNRQPKFRNKVAAFGAWNAFDRILNEPRAGFPVISAFDPAGGKNPNDNETLLNKMLADSYKPWTEGECLDVFTHYAALEYLKTKHPKVLYIAYGETDEWAHSGHYRSYLDAAHQVDQWLQDLWTFIQKDPDYRNKTALLITVDHGRGDQNKNQWTDHGSNVPDSGETWFALIGPGISAKGELKQDMQLYQQQLAQTIAALLALKFTAEHPVAKGVNVR